MYRFIVLVTFIECQSCNSSCHWDSCCEIRCIDHCNHTFSCQIHHETIAAGNTMFRWCTVEVNDTQTPSLIIITFGTSSPCTICNKENDMCCDSDDTLLRINCSTLSTYSALTPSSTINTVSITTATSVPATPSSSVSVTSTIISVMIVPAIGIALILLTLVIAISCVLVVHVIRKKQSNGKQTKAQNQNW